MRFGSWAGEGGRFARRGLTVAARAAAFLFAVWGLAASRLGAQGTPAGTVIRSWAFVTFDTPFGSGFTLSSDTVALTVAQVAGVDVEPPRVSTGAAGTAVVFAHTLANVGNGPDSFTVSAASSHGWPVTLYRDLNGNGILDAADSALAGPVALGYAGLGNLLARVAIPNNASVLGATDTVTTTATSRFDGAVSDAVRDQINVPAAPVTLSLSKQVDRATAVAGDLLSYTLSYATAGGGAALAAQLVDTIPLGVSYVAGTLRWNGTPITDVADGDAGSIVAAGNGVVVVNLGALASGAAGSVTFQAQVSAGPARSVDNRGDAVLAWAGGSDTTASNVASTAVLVPALSLDKQLTSGPVALVGQQVRYTLRYADAAGAAPVQNAAVIDTLPAGLVFVSAAPTPTVAGQVLSWSVGTLAAGDSGLIDLVLAVAAGLRDTLRVRNLAVLESQNAPSVSAAAAMLALVGPPSAGLGLDLAADVLEVGVGEAIPYTATIHNTGVVPVSGIRISATLPGGARYSAGSAIGADSAVAVGGQLTLYAAAPLAPGASRTVRFVAALASAPGAVAAARATAAGQASTGPVLSPEAVAWVQVRRQWPMETRAAIGKVWVDAGDDGVQNGDDAGLAGIDIWTEDGLVATTDSTGKFSFTNLRPGRHAFRLDARSVPAAYQVTGDEIRSVEASGWTTPRVDFRVVPLAPRHVEVRHPLQVTFLARPLHATGQARAAGRVVQYEVTLRNPSRLPAGALVSLQPWADSAVVLVADSPFTRYTPLGNGAIPLPERPGTDVRVLAWTTRAPDSATAVIRLGQTTIPVRAQVHNPLRPTVVTLWDTASAGLPAADQVPPGVELELVLEPTRPSWPVVAYALADGWRAVPGSVRLGGVRAADPEVASDAAGRRWLRWRFAGVAWAPITLHVSTGGAPVDTARLTVPAARTAAQRDAEHAAGFLRGPGIDIFAPADGAVLAGDRVYIGVKGEPNATVMLYDGAKVLDTVRTRIDGVYDFIAVRLERGPHRLRVALRNSWGQERWDSIAVHVTGVPAHFQVPVKPPALVADGRSRTVVDVRVLDRWGVPVAQPAYVTVSAKGADAVGADADPSSVGLQLLSTATGRLAVELRPGRNVGPGTLQLKSGDATATVPLKLLPEVRGLTVAGSGLVGVGASPDAYGAITARGRLDDQTSLTLGLDSRRLNDGRNGLGRVANPLEESQYPILGDASLMEARTASQTWLSARLERGYDWAAFGDLSTTDFASGLSLAQYRRAVTGLAAHVTTGAVTWSGFGSLTSQALRQLQIRGAGVSGPYDLATAMVPGSEFLRIETRALDNPERAVATQGLTRFVDYQIDYTTGEILFKQPIPATDVNGNPVFIVATFEAAAGGPQRLVAGGRAALDVRQLLGVRLDSLRVGLTAVNADQAVHPYRLVGGDVRAMRFGGLDLGAELAYAEQGDSAGIAAAAKANYRALDGALTLGAGFMRVGREFTNPSNVALRPGLTELNLKGGVKVGGTELLAEHSRQRFELQGVDREHSRLGLVQSLRPRLQVEVGVVNDRLDGGSTPSEITAAELKTKWGPSPKLQFWTEARHHLSQYGPDLSPEVWGFGGAYKVTPALALEASQRYLSRPDSQGDYSVSSIGVRADAGHGTQAWGSYQLSGGVSGAGNAAVVGLRNKLQLSPALAVNVLFERRIGVSGAAAGDPVRALPFLQTEGDYWSAGAGVELLPQHAPYRLSARGEYKDGTLQSSRLATLAGDVAFDASLALLSRQELVQNARPGAPLSRRLSSLWGLAFRPAHTDRLNLLAQLHWTDDRNPIGGGVLVSQGAERRMIGAAELIWTPVPSLELGTRYAIRRTRADRMYADSTPQTLTAWADYVGGRVSVAVKPWLSLRGDGRVLVERTSGARTWDWSPALALRPVNGLEVTTGYRFGNLNDPDFSVRGGHGLFVTLSAALTEKLFPTAAEFWRPRF